MSRWRFSLSRRTDETVAIYTQDRVRRAWCRHCNQEVDAVHREAAAALADVSLDTLLLWASDGRVHSPDGSRFICTHNLLVPPTNASP